MRRKDLILFTFLCRIFRFWCWIEAGTFPKQISVGGNTVVWNEHEVTIWMEDQMASRWPRQVGDLNTRRTLCWQGTHRCSAFFCACLKSSVIWNRPGHFPSWVGRVHIKDILRVVVFPKRFGKSFPCCVTTSHLGRSRLPLSPFCWPSNKEIAWLRVNESMPLVAYR